MDVCVFFWVPNDRSGWARKEQETEVRGTWHAGMGALRCAIEEEPWQGTFPPTHSTRVHLSGVEGDASAAWRDATVPLVDGERSRLPARPRKVSCR
jgi:hypothetical protein